MTIHICVYSVRDLPKLLKRISPRYAWTPYDATHTGGTFTVGVRPEIKGTWEAAVAWRDTMATDLGLPEPDVITAATEKI